MSILDNGYCYHIGGIETIVYDETVNGLTQDYGGSIRKDEIEYAIQQLQKHGNKYWTIIDSFSLLLYFMEKENVTVATAHKE